MWTENIIAAILGLGIISLVLFKPCNCEPTQPKDPVKEELKCDTITCVCYGYNLGTDRWEYDDPDDDIYTGYRYYLLLRSVNDNSRYSFKTYRTKWDNTKEGDTVKITCEDEYTKLN